MTIFYNPAKIYRRIQTVCSWGLFVGFLLAWTHSPAAERIKDLATISGVRQNQLIGYGLVVGLDGSGDTTTQAPFTAQSAASMLSQLGVQLPPGVTPQLKNTAAVMVTTQMPAYAQIGQQIDVTVSSLGNAKSLRGGTLLLTPLRGADSQVYAMAQGNLAVGGAGAAAGGSKVQVNHLSAGRVPGGASIERVVPNASLQAASITLELNQTDFSTARAMADAINARFPARGQSAIAQSIDARSVRVALPEAAAEKVAFLADLEHVELKVEAPMARVIINARTGSVIMNQTVSVGPCAIAHGNLSVSIVSTPSVSQPNSLGQGTTTVTEKTDIQIKQESGALMLMNAATKLADVVKALNTLGASAQDLITILQSMRVAGALKAELEII